MVTANRSSWLWQLRQLVPPRPLHTAEGYRVAELQANRLLKLAGADQPGTPDELVTALPYVEVVVRRDVPESGYLNWFKPRWLVVLNAHEPYVRRRFSLFHEFKHLLDHPYRDVLYPSTVFVSSGQRAELVAEYFAACVLMPKRLVVRRWSQRVQRVGALAAEFGVSERAMLRRLQDLGLVQRPVRGFVDGGTSRPLSKTEYFRQRSTGDRDTFSTPALSIPHYAGLDNSAILCVLNGDIAA